MTRNEAPDVMMRWTYRLPSGEERVVRIERIGEDGVGFFPDEHGWTTEEFESFRALYNDFLRRATGEERRP